MTYLDLSTLPIEHPLRNWPLGDIDAEYSLQGQKWKPVKTWRLAKASYNELGPVWHINQEWRARG